MRDLRAGGAGHVVNISSISSIFGMIAMPQSAARRSASRVLVGRDARVLDIMQRLLGAGYQGPLVRGLRRRRQSTRP